MGSILVTVAAVWLSAGVIVVALWNVAKMVVCRRPRPETGRRRHSPRP